MSKHIRDLEKIYDLLAKCRQIFSNLNGDTITSLNRMARVCTEIDNLLEENKHEKNDE